MSSIAITTGMAEGYLTAVADALADAGYTPRPDPVTGRDFVFDDYDDDAWGGAITLPGALPGGLVLIWEMRGGGWSGWSAGYPRGANPSQGADCLTNIGADVAPPGSVVAAMVRLICGEGRVRTSYSRVGRYPVTLLATYGQDGAESHG